VPHEDITEALIVLSLHWETETFRQSTQWVQGLAISTNNVTCHQT